MHSELYLTYCDLPQKKINEEFVNACQYGCLEHIKYLLTSRDLPYKAEIDYCDERGIISACFNGQVEVVKYLLSSPDLSKHANIHARDDYAFKICCNSENYEVLDFLINEFHIEKTEYIAQYLGEHPEVNRIFLARELATEMPNQLSNKKVTKI